MEWTNDAVFEFLCLYENEPALWNTKSANHKNKYELQNAWSRIQSILKDGIVGSIPIKELKKKRDNLMSTYRKLRSKTKESMKSGEIFKPDWPFYNVMSTFLDDVYNPKNTKITVDTENKEETEEDDNENSKVRKEEKKQHNAGGEKSVKTPKNLAKRSKMNEIEKKMDEAYNYFKRITQKAEQDECSLYTELLCKKLRGMQEKTRGIVMLEIDKFIFQVRQNEMQIQSSSQIPSIFPFVSQPLNYQHFPQFSHSTTNNPCATSQSSPETQIYNHSRSPTFHPSSSPQPSPDIKIDYDSQQLPSFYSSPSPQPSPHSDCKYVE